MSDDDVTLMEVEETTAPQVSSSTTTKRTPSAHIPWIENTDRNLSRTLSATRAVSRLAVFARNGNAPNSSRTAWRRQDDDSVWRVCLGPVTRRYLSSTLLMTAALTWFGTRSRCLHSKGVQIECLMAHFSCLLMYWLFGSGALPTYVVEIIPLNTRSHTVKTAMLFLIWIPGRNVQGRYLVALNDYCQQSAIGHEGH
ncbi:hypothetical protein EVAR_98877_1 [Eumeta japonica]|uniref:Uncharacterized protein n=1 Tax=Eumeta variegata TaxID=151549 RepID=A0A4C2AFF8_EUMVA|nr:hypothetical protein EVAR_98877_1 [Eumeta japonica]